MKNAIKIIIILFFIIVVFLYVFYVFILPKMVKSTDLVEKITDKIEQKTDLIINQGNILFNPRLNLSSELKLDKFEILNKNKKQVLYCNNLIIDFRAFQIFPSKITADYLLFNKKNYKTKNENDFSFDFLPQINIKKLDIILEKQSSIKLNNIKTIPQKDKQIISFEGEILSKYFNQNIKIKSTDNLYIKNNELFANDLIFYFKNHPLIIDGLLFSKNSYNFNLKAQSIPTSDIQKTFLFYRKQIKPYEKNFIENFYNFKGGADIDLDFKNKSILGQATLNNFQFKSVKFDIPFYYPKSTFYFKKDKIELKTKGTFGAQKLYTDLFAYNLFTPQKTVTGSLISNVGNEFAKKYFDKIEIIDKINLKVRYFIKYHKPEVEYYARINKGANIYYKNANLDFTDKNRLIYAKTRKENNLLKLKNYHYSTEDRKIIYGEGLFIKKNNKFHLDYITFNIDEFAPLSLLGFENKHFKKGFFKGNFKYLANKKEFLGDFELFFKKFIYKKIIIENIKAFANAKNNIINFHSELVPFAQGTLEAKGFYDYKNKNSDILFLAQNINSNIAADLLFNLENQVEGITNAKMQLKTCNNFKNYNAHTDFSIENGKLTKLASADFLLKNSKHRLQKIINIDPKKLQAYSADIKGSFDIVDEKIQNAQIFNKNKFLSLFIEGNYNIETQCACIELWGKYNKNILKGIKIYFIPLSLIVKIAFKKEYSRDFYKNKIEKIPPIEATQKTLEIIKVNIEGNINNSDNLNIDLKSIK